MNDKLKRKINGFAIALFIVGSLVNIAFTFYVIYQYKNDKAEIPETAIYENIKNECKQAFTLIGFRPEMEGNILKASINGLNTYGAVLAKSSLAIKDCPGFRLEKACMGTECNNDFELTLRFYPK